MAASPFSSNPKFQTLREQKEVNAGTQFFQTNLIYDIEGLETLFNELAKRNVLYKVYMLMRITPPKSWKVAQILYKVPRIYLPKAVMEQMKTADQAGNAQEDGIQVALSSFTKIKVVHRQGIDGIHLMPVGWFEVIPRIIMEADLLPRSSTVQTSMH